MAKVKFFSTDQHTVQTVTIHVFVKHGYPPAATKSKSGKSRKSHILTPPHQEGHLMSGKSEQPLDELTVQVCMVTVRPPKL